MADTPFHEAASIFPLMEGEALEALAEDIRQNELQLPIELLDGQVIDGRNRYKACLLAGIDPEEHMIDVETDDPVAYVLSMNLHRRHLTVSQAAMCAQRARKMYDDAAKKRQREAGKQHGKGQSKLMDNCPQANEDDDPPSTARDQVGKAFGVSGGSVDRAQRVVEKGIPEIAAAVEAGNLTVYAGQKIAANPKRIQKDMLDAALSKSRQSPKADAREKEEKQKPGGRKGVILANEAINCLTRIPKRDTLRKRGFQLVSDWIKANK